MFTLLIERTKEYRNVVTPNNSKIEDSTISVLKLLSPEHILIWKGYCCENIGPSTDASGTDKRIMPGSYHLDWCASNKNGALSKKYPQYKLPNGKNKAIWVKRDPKFDQRLIRIHTGNGPANTEGCILPGLSTSGTGLVGNSVEACHQLFTHIDKIGIENIELVILEIGDQ